MLTDDDLAAWIAGLDDLFALVAGRFFRVEPRRRAAGDGTPDGMQRLLNTAAWDVIAALLALRDQVIAPSWPGPQPSPRPRPAHRTRINRDYETLRIGMQTLFHDLGIATPVTTAA